MFRFSPKVTCPILPERARSRVPNPKSQQPLESLRDTGASDSGHPSARPDVDLLSKVVGCGHGATNHHRSSPAKRVLDF